MTTQTYYTLLTAIGGAELANAQAFGTTVPITHLAVGDGNGNPVIPTESMMSLVHEVQRVPVSSMTTDVDNPNWLVIEAVLPSTVGGWTIRELGLIGGSGVGNKLLAFGNFPDTYKPLIAEGAAKDLVIRMIIEVSSSAIVNLTVNSGVAVATTASVANAIAAHEAKLDPHPQYLTQPKGDARYRLKTDVIAATDLWISASTAQSLPAEGGLRIHNLSGANTITLDATTGTPNKVALAIAHIGGSTILENASGVRINIAATANAAALNYAMLTSNGITQGVWSNATYGRVSYVGSTVGNQQQVEKETVATVDVGNNIAVVAVTYATDSPYLTLQAINVASGQKGAITTYSGGTSNGGLVGAWKTAANQLVLIASTWAITATVNPADLSIVFGAPYTGVGPFNEAYQVTHFATSVRLAASQFLLAGLAQSTGLARCQVLNVNTGTGAVTCSAYADGPQFGGTKPQLEAASATSALLAGEKGAIGISITAGVPSFDGAALALPSGIADGNLRPTIAGVTSAGNYAVAYYDKSAPTSYKVAVVSLAGTTPTWGTPATVTESVSSGLQGRAKLAMYPNCWYQNWGAVRQRVFQYSADTFLVANVKLIGFSAAGTTVTAGAAVNTSATLSSAACLPDGTWVYSDSQAAVTRKLTMVGNTITPGVALFNSYSENLVGFNEKYLAGRYKVGASYLPYAPVENITFPLNSDSLAVTTSPTSPNQISILEKFL